MAGAFERDYDWLFWRGEDGVELRAHQMDRALVVSVRVEDDLHAQQTDDFDSDERIGHRIHHGLHPEPAQHYSALLGSGYDGEGDFASPSFPAATAHDE